VTVVARATLGSRQLVLCSSLPTKCYRFDRKFPLTGRSASPAPSAHNRLRATAVRTLEIASRVAGALVTSISGWTRWRRCGTLRRALAAVEFVSRRSRASFHGLPGLNRPLLDALADTFRAFADPLRAFGASLHVANTIRPTRTIPATRRTRNLISPFPRQPECPGRQIASQT
jgi:hypothetical protein